METETNNSPRNNKHFYTYSKITKARIGQVIIRECGNEGTEDTTEKAERRRLLQKVIEVIQEDKEFESMSDDMLITVFDSYGHTVKIRAGKGVHKVTVTNDADGEADVIWKRRSRGCVIV